MPTITNTGKAGRGLPRTSTGRIVEFRPGESVEFSQADWDAIKNRVTVQANLKEGSLKVTGDGELPPAPVVETITIAAVVTPETVAVPVEAPPAPAPKSRTKATKEVA